MMWRVRARVRDSQTGDELDLRTRQAATDVCSALERGDAGELEPLPPDASPFRRFEVLPGQDGWYYITRAEGALDHEPFGRTRSNEFAARVAAAMNRTNPRKLRDPHGPPKARWF
jgi:hypothetical protein